MNFVRELWFMRAKVLSFSLFVALLFALFVPSAGAAYPGAPTVRATSALFLNIDSGAVLLSQNTEAEIDPGSLVKLMTGILVVENVKDLEGTVTVSETAIQGLDGLTTSSLQPGEEMTARDLLCCALVYSSADACNALAEHSAGSIDQFVKMMNEKAKELGMEHTVFVNTHGGPAAGLIIKTIASSAQRTVRWTPIITNMRPDLWPLIQNSKDIL